jgi:hypothetical protein
LPHCLGNSRSAALCKEIILSEQKPTRAADNLLTLTLPLDQVIAERLQDIPGEGEAIADMRNRKPSGT